MYDNNESYSSSNGLPIGFAITYNENAKQDFVGFTCAACHTGQINYISPQDNKLKALRIDGGVSMHALDKFREALVASITETHLNENRFNRFATKILGPNASKENKDILHKALTDAVRKGVKTGLVEYLEHIYPTTEGYGRLDALQRISNTVFCL